MKIMLKLFPVEELHPRDDWENDVDSQIDFFEKNSDERQLQKSRAKLLQELAATRETTFFQRESLLGMFLLKMV